MPLIPTRRAFLAAGIASTAALALKPGSARAQISTPAADPEDSTLHLVDPQYREMAQAMPAMLFTPDILPDIRTAQDATTVPGSENPVFESVELPDSPASFFLYRPDTLRATPTPAIVYIHGGGYILGSAVSYHAYCYDLAQKSGAVVASVEYRLAPETPFPGPIEDCYDVFSYVFRTAARLGIDPDRISIMGASAGGGLTAALALLARDRGQIPVKAQFPIYPMLDYRTGTQAAPVDNPTTGEFVWGRAANRFGWTSLRGDYGLDDDRVGHFSPSHAATLEGLPPCFMVVGALDLFMEENAAYALRLSRDGVPVDFTIYPGAIHGFDIVPGTELTQRFDANLKQAFDRLL
ncbi:alpha/beta hydrolase [Rhodobacteraceae bacterium R_SAG8]|nr:alpha/beta hydrolase [Rhodobacteraceae bacterium R_SAG8]